jgi:hypothetical protein
LLRVPVAAPLAATTGTTGSAWTAWTAGAALLRCRSVSLGQQRPGGSGEDQATDGQQGGEG